MIPALSTPPAAPPVYPDLFALGRRAALAARAAAGGRGVFSRSRQLLGSGTWNGPRDAALSYVEEENLPALGGAAPAFGSGARILVATSRAGAQQGQACGMTLYFRLSYRAGEPEPARRARRDELQALLSEGLPISGVIPTPDGEPMGLDTLRMMAFCRLGLDGGHVVADFNRLGHRLAQMSLGFGADELWGPILPERSLRLGGNANNPVMTRKEAAALLRGAGLRPCERLSDGRLEEVSE
jgi:hypothetical protein